MNSFGMLRSLVAHFVRDEGVGSSNLLIPTSKYNGLRVFRDPFFGQNQ